MFLICLFFAPLPFLSMVPPLSPPLDLCAPHPSSSPIPLHFSNIPPLPLCSLPLLLSCTPSCIAASLIAHVGKYICRREKGDSLSLSVSRSLSLPLSVPPVLSLSPFFPPTLSPRHPTNVISTGCLCLSRAPAFQPAAANEPLCERKKREREGGNEGTRLRETQ